MNPICRYDFTLHVENEEDQLSNLLNWCKNNCKQYVFQLEKGEVSNKLHFQGRISLTIKIRLESLINKTKLELQGIHWSITSNNCKNFNYCMKSETRVSGPWCDNDSIGTTISRETRKLIENDLLEWQKSLMEICTTYEERTIYCIYDKDGCKGKSIFTKYMIELKDAVIIPPFNDSTTLIQTACSFGKKKIYFLDLPRSMKKDHISGIYAAIEQIKGGILIDTRYKAKIITMDNPQIIIFTNTIPDLEYLSRDRWRFKTISDSGTLEDLNINLLNFINPNNSHCPNH